MMINHLLAIGIMTGNSLDAADVVLTEFAANGIMKDVAFHSLPFPEHLQADLRHIRGIITEAHGDMEAACRKDASLAGVIKGYTAFVARAVHELLESAGTRYQADVIGFHAQTCAHHPPSLAKTREDAYTIQVGDGQLLANLTGITTIYDFRSDDLMQGGEGAPLAPVHNRHIAEQLREGGYFPLTFINAGNTSSIAHVTRDADGNVVTVGWDAGPCNHFPDLLVRAEKGMQCDRDGNIGKRGRIREDLLRGLFYHAAVTPRRGENFLEKQPPKSSDPQWYHTPKRLLDQTIPLEDRLRTAEYFSAYLLFHSLGYTDRNIELPSRFALFGGGWKNPLVREHFSALLKGNFADNPILEEHRERFEAIHRRLQGKQLSVADAAEYGFDGQAMEARIFADMARCRITGEPFTAPHITGGKRAVVCGIICYPFGSPENATPNLRSWMQTYRVPPSYDASEHVDSRWSRAAAGWAKWLI